MSDQNRKLTHLDDRGAARMVDVTEKSVTIRTATAYGRVLVSADVVALLRGEGVPKGATRWPPPGSPASRAPNAPPT